MPKVFISYSWDSPEHQNKVFNLSNRLRKDGIDCEIDQYYESPEGGWPKWMEEMTRESDYIIVVCTKTYLNKCEEKEKKGKGQGIKWETLLLYNDIYYEGSKYQKIVPAIFNSDDKKYIPRPLKGSTYYDVSDNEEYLDLYRYLTGQPEKTKPPLGEIVDLSIKNKSTMKIKKRVWKNSPTEKFICVPQDVLSSIPRNFISNGSVEIIDAFTKKNNDSSCDDSLVNELNSILGRNHKGRIILIEGEPGSGKSIVSKNILGVVSQIYDKDGLFFPIYIDLMACEKKFVLGESFNSCYQFIKDSISKALESTNGCIVIDGVDFLNPLNNDFVRYILKQRKDNVLIFFKRTYKDIPGTRADRDIENVSPNAKYMCKLDDSFISFDTESSVSSVVTSSLGYTAKNIFDVRDTMVSWFFENRTNMRLYHMLLSSQGRSLDNEKPQQYLNRFFYSYISQYYLTPKETEKVKIESRKLAYSILIKQRPDYKSEKINTISKRIATQSFEMMGHLSARFVCNEILRLGELDQNKLTAQDRKDVKYIDQVHTYLLNKYAKEIIIESKEKQEKYYMAIINLYDSGSTKLKAFLCYLLGRFKDKSIKEKSSTFLLDLKDKIDNKDEKLKEYPLDTLFLVLHRTIYISLIYLGNFTDDEYVKIIMSSSRLDSINRGFHRQYYGDADSVSNPEMTLSDDTDLGIFKNTLKQIKEKIVGDSSSSKQTINLSAYTFLSLCLSRHQDTSLEKTLSKKEALQIIKIIVEKEGFFKPCIYRYALVVQGYLNSDLSPLLQSVVNMYQLKSQQRKGWTFCNEEKTRKVINPDSVSEHSDFAVRLAQIFLPSNEKMEILKAKDGPLEKHMDIYKDYNKHTIIAMLINHDLGEWLHGDIVRTESTPPLRKKEKLALCTLSMLTASGNSELLEDPYNSIYYLWDIYNSNDKVNINSKIAREIDNIECLIQLCLFVREKENEISDAKLFFLDLREKIKTKLSQEIAKNIVDPMYTEFIG